MHPFFHPFPSTYSCIIHQIHQYIPQSYLWNHSSVNHSSIHQSMEYLWIKQFILHSICELISSYIYSWIYPLIFFLCKTKNKMRTLLHQQCDYYNSIKVTKEHCVEYAYLLMFRWCSQMRVHCRAVGLPFDVSPTRIHYSQSTYQSSRTCLNPQNHTQNPSPGNLSQTATEKHKQRKCLEELKECIKHN